MATERIPRGRRRGDGTSLALGQFGRYFIERELGRGGMASVYLATLTGVEGFTRRVALKVIHPHLARDASIVDMFLDEARLAARVQHANVCQVFDCGWSNDRYYIAMEYLDGVPLIRLVDGVVEHESQETFARYMSVAARIVRGACNGLHAAHELTDEAGVLLGVVHRDVSPYNIVVTFDGVTKIVDFGIAKARDKIHRTDPGTVKGNFGYVAPEQLRGLDVDRRADVWSLGVIAWELCTGQRLFRRPSQGETVRAVELEAIRPPSSARPGLPGQIDAVVLGALRRNREERYPTTHAFGEAFARAVGSAYSTADTASVVRWLASHFPAAPERTELDVAETFVPESKMASVSIEVRPVRKRTHPWVLASVALMSMLASWVLFTTQTTTPIATAIPLPTDTSTRSSTVHRVQPAATAVVEAPPKKKRGRRRSRRPRVVGTGELHLVTIGASAPVFLGDRLIAWSPLVERLPAGRHVLEVRPTEGAPHRVRIHIRANQSTRVVVNLD